MECKNIDNGCLKLKEFNDIAKGTGTLELGIFENLSNWGFPKHNGKYVLPSCLNGSYCAVRSE